MGALNTSISVWEKQEICNLLFLYVGKYKGVSVGDFVKDASRFLLRSGTTCHVSVSHSLDKNFYINK